MIGISDSNVMFKGPGPLYNNFDMKKLSEVEISLDQYNKGRINGYTVIPCLARFLWQPKIMLSEIRAIQVWSVPGFTPLRFREYSSVSFRCSCYLCYVIS